MHDDADIKDHGIRPKEHHRPPSRRDTGRFEDAGQADRRTTTPIPNSREFLRRRGDQSANQSSKQSIKHQGKFASQGRHQLPALHELKTRCHHGSSRGRRLRARRYWLRFGGVGDIKQGVTLCGHQRNRDHTTTKRKETQIRVDSRACASPPTS